MFRKYYSIGQEGDEHGSNRQAVRYFRIAKGSIAEVQTQNEIAFEKIAFEIGYLTREQYDDIEHRCNALSIKLLHLIKSRMES
jgi:four helix bundle protein